MSAVVKPANDVVALRSDLPKIIMCFDIELLPQVTAPNTTVYKNSKFCRSGPHIVYRAHKAPECWSGVVLVGGTRIPVHGENHLHIVQRLQDAAKREIEWQQALWMWAAKLS